YIPHYFASCFTHTAPTQIHPLSLHDALPISPWVPRTSSPAAATRSHPPTARPTRAPCPTSATNRASEPPAARSRRALIHLRFFSCTLYLAPPAGTVVAGQRLPRRCRRPRRTPRPGA